MIGKFYLLSLPILIRLIFEIICLSRIQYKTFSSNKICSRRSNCLKYMKNMKNPKKSLNQNISL